WPSESSVSGSAVVRRVNGRLYAAPKTYVPRAATKNAPLRSRGARPLARRARTTGAQPVRAVSVDDALEEVQADQPVEAVEDGGGGGLKRIRPDDDGADVASRGRA